MIDRSHTWQRGSIALYLLFSLAVSSAVGYGVYVLLRDRPSSTSADAAPQPRRVDRRADPSAAHTVRPGADSAHRGAARDREGGAPVAVDVAERDAVAPASIEGPETDTVLLGTPGIAGALDVDGVERTVKRYMVRWQRCMRRARERGTLVRGDLRLSFVVAADGKVAGVTRRATVDDELASCVTEVLARLRFDVPRDGALVKVVYPMAFVPARDGSDPARR